MPLPTPILDDRSYQQLRDELVRRIPVYNPEWTDHNPSDPGVTLIELFSFLGENLLYRFNQIPETTKLGFLKLLQIPLRPASAAQAIVVFTSPSAKPGDVPPRVDPGTALKAGAVSFETLTEVTVTPWRFLGVARTKADPPDPTEAPEATEFAMAAIDARGGLKAGESALFYKNDLLPEDPAAPTAKPVDFGATVDGVLWIAVIGDHDFLPDFADKTINVGFVPDEEVRAGDPIDPCPGTFANTPRRDPCAPATADGAANAPQIAWEISTGQLDAQTGEPIYASLVVSGDTTRGLTAQGVVRLAMPHDVTTIGAFTLADPDLQGTGNFPPALDDKADAASTVFWLRAYDKSEDHRFGRITWVGGNAAQVAQTRKAPAEYLGTGTGQPSQRYQLIAGGSTAPRPAIVAGSLVVEVEEQPGQWARWSPVDSFDASGEDDKHYVVDLEARDVLFGNGVSGLPPQIGQRVRATEYRYGGGLYGNVAAKAINKLDAPGNLKVQNPLAARGGADSEAIAAALERLPAELRRHDRAVTQSDFQELALATPGADLGRAECLPLFDPKTLSTQAAGIVSVVVWPREDSKHPSAPMPDRTTLRAVCSWLDQRRLVTTELYVIAPSYVPIAVAVGIHVKPGYGIDAVRSWVELVIRQYLAPLPPYGPEGRGWPLGRRVYAPELEAAALQVEGVEYIDEGDLAVASKQNGAWVTGPVMLLSHQVPELAVITVVAGPRLEAGVPLAPPPPLGLPIPIPTIVVEC